MRTLKKICFLLAAGLFWAGYLLAANPARAQAPGWTPDNGDGTFTNPLMWGDWPDPDIIRVGDDFYFSSTSMHYVPGCPIAKSKDLVNWEMAGYAVDRYDEDPKFDMQGGTLYLNGSWASTIRHHNGKFYVGFCTPRGGKGTGCFSMCVADNVAGPWKRTIFPEYLYDPGLFFDDDGKAYIAHGQGTIFITPLAADALSVAGKPVKIIEHEPVEGSHMYKINGKYFIFSPAAGIGSQLCFRSDHIYGPYEKKVVMHDTRNTGYGVHQGGLVQLKNGDWWCLIMEDRGPIGRVPRLEPVTWVDGWPMIGRKNDQGEWIGVDTWKKPAVDGHHPVSIPATTDEFDSPMLGLQWQWNHNPDNANWSLAERPGFLRLKAGAAGELMSARNTLTQRVQGPESEAVVELDVRGLKDGDTAGLGILQRPYGFIAARRDNGQLKVVMNNNGKEVDAVSGVAGDTLWFKAAATSKGFKAAFAYSTDGKQFITCGNQLAMGLGLAWTANRFALFNFSTTGSGVGGIADFNYCRVSMTNTVLAPATSGAFTITASSEQPDNPAANAMDGNPDTRWCAEDDSTGQWVQIGFGQPRAVAKADVTWEYPGNYGASIEGSNDEKNWKPLPGSFRFIRVTVTAMPPGKWASIREVKLTGPDGKELAGPAAPKPSPAAIVKQFPHPDRIAYDGHCLTIDGQDTFINSASFHYFRTPRELWRDRFQKIKAAGFNTVETYVPWNWHERDLPAGLDDFSKIDLSEIEAWLKMAQDEFGLYTIVRPGPFICAEWAGGGYPRWLAKFAPPTGNGFWLRSADDAHIAWSVHWYDAVCKLFAREQLTRKPKGGKGIILVQIENEYDADGSRNKPKLLRALYAAVKNAGVDVPVFTCLTSECRESSDPVLSQVFDCDNYYVGLTEAPSCAQRMMSLRRHQPDAPGLVTELQGGWFSTVGGSLSEDNYSDARHYNAICLMSLLGGAAGLNTYVFVGGTHFGGWGARGQTTSYDYNAAIREWGTRGPKYTAAEGIAQFIRDNASQLLRAEGGPCELKDAPKNLFGGVRVGPDGTKFLFLHNTDPKNAISGHVTVLPGKITQPAGPAYNIDQNGNRVLIKTDTTATEATALPPLEVTYQLAGLDAKVLVIPPGKSPAEGVWYPKPQQAIARPDTVPAPVRLASALKQNDPLDGPWQPLPAGKSLPELGVSDQRYVLYQTSVSLTEAEATNDTKLLINSFSRDIVSAQVNGHLAKRLYPSETYAAAATRNTGKSFARIQPNEFYNRFDLAGLLRGGNNEIVLLYENIGHEHGYFPMEELSGVRQAGISDNDKAIAKVLDWQVATNLGGITAGWTQPDFSAVNWTRVALNTNSPIARKGNDLQPKGHPDALLTWYRLEFELPATPAGEWIPWRLLLNASGNGFMWLNGHDIGRHWEKGPQREYFLPDCWLHTGPGQKNVIVLGLRETVNGALLNAAEVSPYPDSAEIIDTK